MKKAVPQLSCGSQPLGRGAEMSLRHQQGMKTVITWRKSAGEQEGDPRSLVGWCQSVLCKEFGT